MFKPVFTTNLYGIAKAMTMRTSYLAAMLTLTAPLWAGPALANCDATNRFQLDWDSYANGSLSTATTHNYTLTNGAGATRNVSLQFTGDNADYITISGVTAPAINNTIIGTPTNEKVLFLASIFDARVNNINSTNNVAIITFNFSTAVHNVSLKLVDIDFANRQYRDFVRVSGRLATTNYNPALSTPYYSGAGWTSPSTVRIGPHTQSGHTLAANEAVGWDTASGNFAQNGDLNVSFAAPINQLEIRYANGPAAYTSGTIGQQGIGVHDISFCPMPALVITKSSAPIGTVGESRFAVPGNDMIYSITVANNGGSPVDLDSVRIEDLLPANLSFFNGDFDGSGPLTGPFEFLAGSSGASCCTASNISYGTGSSPTWGYSPAAGYDPAVRALRWLPGGSIAANSSFTIRFRARIN